MAEDAAFAKACGLANRVLELEGAFELAQKPLLRLGWGKSATHQITVT
jgi:hypothetical protein